MSRNYLSEAFKEMELLEGASFDFNKDGAEKLANYLEDDTLSDLETIIDPEAETEEDLQPSYIGMAILQCEVCKSNIYKAPEEIEIDEEVQLANVGELCPYCFSGDGYSVIGKIVPFEEVTVEAEEPVEVEVDGKKVDAEEPVEPEEEKVDEKDLNESVSSVKEKLARRGFKVKAKEEPVNEFLGPLATSIGASAAIGSIGTSLNNAIGKAFEGVEEETAVNELFDRNNAGVGSAALRAIEQRADKFLDKAFEDVENEEKVDEGLIGDISINLDSSNAQVPFLGGTTGGSNTDNRVNESAEKTIVDKLLDLLHSKYPEENAVREGVEEPVEEEVTEEEKADGDSIVDKLLAIVRRDMAELKPVVDKVVKEIGPELASEFSFFTLAALTPEEIKILKDPREIEARDKIIAKHNSGYSEVGLGSEGMAKSELKEGMEDISITTETDVIKVKSTPREDKEAIAPIQPEEVEAAKEEVVEEPAVEEAPAGVEGDAGVEETPEEDIVFDEFDEESFDELGESYLKRVYENVDGYKTTGASIKKNTLKLEGLITFASGKKAKTAFLFESDSMTKKGKFRFIGENKNLSNNKKAFSFIGTNDGGKLICESFTYNYLGKDAKTNASKKLYGRVTRK